MALIKCPECKKEISSSSNSCPHCGYSKPKPKQYGCGSVILIFLISWIAYSALKPTPKTTDRPKTPEEIRAEKISNMFFMGKSIRCENWIKDFLKDPDSFESIETRYLDKGEFFIVNVTYRAKNSFNGFVIKTGTCKLSLENVVLEGIPEL